MKTRDAVFDSSTPKPVASAPLSSPSSTTRVPPSTPGPTGSGYAFWLDPGPLSQVDPIPLDVLNDPDPSPPSPTHLDQTWQPSPVQAAAPRRSERSKQPPSRYGHPRANISTALSPSYRQAVSGLEQDAWKAAMKLEVENLVRMKVFELVPCPGKAKFISCCWHLKKKLRNNGSLDKFKDCLVARGFTQCEGLDFDQTFAPSSQQESLKGFLSIVGHEDWEVVQLDVFASFLYGLLDEVIYMNQPEGFEDASHPDHVWRLNKSLYGLKQLARQ